MTTIVINEKTKKGRLILELIQEMGIGKIIDGKKTSGNHPNAETILAIKAAREGNTTKCLDFNDYLAKVK
jgi:hypothetical protein